MTSSFTALFESFKDSPKIVLNDKFMGDQGAKQLAEFLSSHRRVQYLEIKSNDITSQGFTQIFTALLKSSTTLRQLIVQYNKLGENQYSDDWKIALENLLSQCPKLERLNISNNAIKGESFVSLIGFLTQCKNLKLLELKYNKIDNSSAQKFLQQLKRQKNESLLYVELAGNSVKRQLLEQIESFLKINRGKNPISKDKIMMVGTSGFGQQNRGEFQRSQSGNFRQNGIQDITMTNLSKQNIVRHLQEILDQNRKDTAQMKVRLQQELQDLQKRQRNDTKQLNDLDNKCNELLIANRNLKFQLDRTNSQHQQIQRDQQYHMRMHEEKLREANKQIMDLQNKFEEIEQRMNKQHEIKLKQIAREWETRLRGVQEKIRMTQNENNVLDSQIKKAIDKKQRLRVEYMEEQSLVRTRVQQEQSQRYNFKLSALQSKLRQVQESREQFIRRNQDLLYELEKGQSANGQSITDLDEELSQLKSKQDEFVRKNKDFISRNEKLKSDIQLKQIGVEQLEQQINRLNGEIEVKKGYNRDQIDKIIQDAEYDRTKRQQEKQAQINKLNNLEAELRTSQLENAKLRQQYAILAQKLQIGLGKAVQQVFAQNSLY